MLNITMPRGDIRKVKFDVKDNTGAERNDFTEIYLTVKNNSVQEEALFQKKLSDGSIVYSEGYYHTQIECEDTDGLSYGNYKFDIELLGENLKETFVGILSLTEEVTFIGNET